MEYDDDKIADTVLALLSMTMHDESEYGCRAYKNIAWSVMDQLHQRGFIDDPKNKSKSVRMTQIGMERSLELFDQMFAKRESAKG